MSGESLSWLENGKTYPVTPVSEFERDGSHYVQGTLTSAPRFPILFRVAPSGLVRLSHEEAAAVISRQLDASLDEACVTGTGSKLLPIREARLDGRDFIVLFDRAHQNTVVGEVRGDAIEQVSDEVTSKAVEALFFLVSLPDGVVEESVERRRASMALEKARAHVLKMSSTLATLGKAGQTDDEYERLERAYNELSRAVLEAEERLAGAKKVPEGQQDVGRGT